jgi:hypothetical protein
MARPELACLWTGGSLIDPPFVLAQAPFGELNFILLLTVVTRLAIFIIR